MKDNKLKELLGKALLLLSGSGLLAFGITAILRPNGLITGGVTGLSIVVAELIQLNYTYLYYGMTLVVLLSAFALLGKEEGAKIIFLSIAFPAILIVFDHMNFAFVENDLFLASIYYGVFAGAGVGLLMRGGFSLGGTDTIAKILHRKQFAFMSLSQILLFIDVAIVILSLTAFDKRIALYAIITQYVFMKTMETVLFGFGSRKVKIEIISEKYEEISDFIINEIHRGTSIFAIQGGYSRQTKHKVTSICSPRESMIIRKMIAQTDSAAFVDVLPVSSVWGEGVGFDSLLDED